MLLPPPLLVCTWLAASPALSALDDAEPTDGAPTTRVTDARSLLALAEAERKAWRAEVRALGRAWGRADDAARQDAEAALRRHLEALRDDLGADGVWRPATEASLPTTTNLALRDAVLVASLTDRTEHEDAVRDRLRAWIVLEAAWDAHVRRLHAAAPSTRTER